MSTNYNKINEIRASIESELNKLNISDDKDTKNCPRCDKPFIEKLWCKECDPCRRIEGWTSENFEIDKFIKDTIYNTEYNDWYNYRLHFFEWVPFNRFKDVKLIGEGGYAKVYSAMWVDGRAQYTKEGESWKKSVSELSEPREVALKRLNGSQNMSAEYLNELKVLWELSTKSRGQTLGFYGLTKDPETREFIMIMEFADQGDLRHNFASDFNNILWDTKIKWLLNAAFDLNTLHELGYFRKDFHCGNILKTEYASYVSDFGLSGPANEQKSNGTIHGVLPYIAPEVLNGEPYTAFSDVYSFGVIMTELSSGKPPFHKRDHDHNLALEICNGLRPECGKGTPEIYKRLAENVWTLIQIKDQQPMNYVKS